MATQDSVVFEFAGFRLDPAERLLVRNGSVVSLTPKAFDLLVYLVERRGRLVEKNALMSALWPDTVVEESNLAFQVSALRKVLDEGRDGESLIQTVPTKGYRFVAPVVAPVRGAADVGLEPLWRRRRPWLLASTGVVVIGTIWFAFGLTPRRHGLPLNPALPAPHLVRLTTLPGMADSPALSPDGEQVVFSWRKPSGHASNLYVMMVGSPEVRQLTSGEHDEWAPAWSPDGRQIAFLRWADTLRPAVSTNPRAQIYVVSAIGGQARRVSDYPALGRLAWTPDQRSILAGRNPDVEGARGIYVVPMDGSTPRLVVSSVAPNGVFSPALVRNGRRLAYAECRSVSSYSPANCDANVVDVDGDLRLVSAPRRVASMRNLARLTWTRDGQSIVFVGDPTGAGVWRMFRTAVGKPATEAIDVAGVRVDHPTTTPAADRLVFTRIDLDVDVFAAHADGAPSAPVLSSAGNDTEPEYSSSGSQVAFISDRTDHQEVWIAAADGSDQRQLTRGPNDEQRSPRWSPDDHRVAFQSRAQDSHWHIWTIDADGGAARQLTFGDGNQTAPTWSSDGRWIYFSDERASGLDIWRVDSRGGPATQITTTGSGFAALESADGQSILYQQGPSDGPLLLLPLAGGLPRQVVRCAQASAYTWTPRGVFYLPCDAPPDVPVHRLDLATGRNRIVATLERLDVTSQTGVAVSPDGSTVLYPRLVNEDRGASLWMIEHFR